MDSKPKPLALSQQQIGLVVGFCLLTTILVFGISFRGSAPARIDVSEETSKTIVVPDITTTKPQPTKTYPKRYLAPTSSSPYNMEQINIFIDGQTDVITYPIRNNDGVCDVAITTALSSAGDKLDIGALHEVHLIKDFFPTLSPTLSPGYRYCLYFGVDSIDPFYANRDGQKAVVEFIRAWAEKTDANMAYVTWTILPYKKHSAWAHNDAVMTAHRDGVKWFYRVNDDTQYISANWTERFISVLNRMDRIGVVGPKHATGNTNILTYDFTHRTHIHIYGYHWPRAFPNWYGDEWITKNYEPSDRMKKLPDIKLRHIVHKSRYEINVGKGDPVGHAGLSMINATKITHKILEEYLKCRETKSEFRCRNYDYVGYTG